MPAPHNPFKARLAGDAVQIGCWLNLLSPVSAEISGTAGFDWCLIDGEHGPFDPVAIRAQLQALAATGTPAAVRVPVAEAWALKQVLDLGAQTILVPMVDDAAAAREMARAARFPPEGTRGLAAVLIRASGYGADQDYVATANAEICLMVQAESRAAVENIDAIAATDGVDAVLIGPSDLAADMGHTGRTDAPEVVEAMAHVVRRTVAAGKAAGIFCLEPERFAHLRDLGVTVLAVSADVPALAGSLRGQASRAREILG